MQHLHRENLLREKRRVLKFPRVIWRGQRVAPQREFFIGNLLVQIHFIIVMIRWTGLAPWEFEFPFSRQPYI